MAYREEKVKTSLSVDDKGGKDINQILFMSGLKYLTSASAIKKEKDYDYVVKRHEEYTINKNPLSLGKDERVMI